MLVIPFRMFLTIILRYFCLFFVSLNSPVIYGAEVDHFHARLNKANHQSIKDIENKDSFEIYPLAPDISPSLKSSPNSFYQSSQDSLNFFNKLIKKAILKAMEIENHKARVRKFNSDRDYSQDQKCFRESLLPEIRRQFIRLKRPFDQLRESGEKEHFLNFDYNYIDFEGSIYKNLDASDGPLLASSYKNRMLGPMVRIGKYIVGTDKFEHFIYAGEYMFNLSNFHSDVTVPNKYIWDVFKVSEVNLMTILSFFWRTSKKRSLKDGNLLDSLLYSYSTELGMLGQASSGILSNADLMANYKGLLFYQDLFDRKNPFLQCAHGSWKLTKRNFSWLDYIDHAWDESINCNEYASVQTENKVKDEIKKLGFKSCPVMKKECAELGEKYQLVQDYVLHPSCRLKL